MTLEHAERRGVSEEHVTNGSLGIERGHGHLQCSGV
jgi:hypothetical protein